MDAAGKRFPGGAEDCSPSVMAFGDLCPGMICCFPAALDFGVGTNDANLQQANLQQGSGKAGLELLRSWDSRKPEDFV